MVLPNFFIIVPMYIYPSGSTWNTLYNSIATNPNVNWRVIVNPDSGPGDTSYPNSDYVSAVAQLNNYANVQTLGYVHTSYGTRPLSNVTADIAVYAGWSAYNGSDIHVDGIFFDESPIDTQYVNYMTQANSFAKQKITGGSPKAYTVFNTGVNAPSPFYALADSILAYENSYSVSNSTGQNAALNAIPAAVRNTSLVVINHYTNTTAQLALDTAGLMQENIAGLFITTKPSYGTFSAGWTQFVGDVARGVGKGS